MMILRIHRAISPYFNDVTVSEDLLQKLQGLFTGNIRVGKGFMKSQETPNATDLDKYPHSDQRQPGGGLCGRAGAVTLTIPSQI